MAASVKPKPAPNAVCPRQGAYADYRRAWRKAVDAWLAAGRPDHLELKA